MAIGRGNKGKPKARRNSLRDKIRRKKQIRDNTIKHGKGKVSETIRSKGRIATSNLNGIENSKKRPQTERDCVRPIHFHCFEHFDFNNDGNIDVSDIAKAIQIGRKDVAKYITDIIHGICPRPPICGNTECNPGYSYGNIGTCPGGNGSQDEQECYENCQAWCLEHGNTTVYFADCHQNNTSEFPLCECQCCGF